MRHCQVTGCNTELPDYWKKDACDECFNKIREEYDCMYVQAMNKKPGLVLTDKVKYKKFK